MNRREFIRSSARYLLASALLPETLAQAETRPGRSARQSNILLIVADDLGYAELGVQGCRDIPTPHIDSLAANGIRFTDGYVSCPVCSPTRAGLMTGRYQQRFGHEFNPGSAVADPKFGLPASEKTLAERLKALGYATGMVGKWHLGSAPGFRPLQRGFDEFFGFLGGAHPYLPSGPAGRRSSSILRGTEPVVETEYLTDAFAREAVAFIDRHKRRPFFLYLPFNAVHAPMEAPEKYLARFPSIPHEKRRTFAAMLSAMDDAVGRVLAKLREEKLEEETLLFFLSDNGGPTQRTTSRNSPLRGVKGRVFEGGIRVPFLAQWRGHLPAGKTYTKPVIALDIFPTAIAAAGGEIDPAWKLDGVNLLPYLRGENRRAPHDRLFWRFGDQSAVRMGDWKLVMSEGSKPALYHVAQDIAEKNDLAAKEPERVRELTEAYRAWDAQNVAPRWGGGGGRRRLRGG